MRVELSEGLDPHPGHPPVTHAVRHAPSHTQSRQSYPFHLTQQPAITVPCGLTTAGLPVGLQIVGRAHDDATVLRAARAYEAGHPAPRPVI